MASSKSSSRSRTAHSATPAKTTPNKLEENLNVFKSDNFDADGYVQTKCNSLNEKVRPPLSSLIVAQFVFSVILFIYFLYIVFPFSIGSIKDFDFQVCEKF